MTTQIPDTIIYKGEKYYRIDFLGQMLAKPQDFGMQPDMMHTACILGFFSTYEITDDGIYLKEMTLREERGNYKPIDGVNPVFGIFIGNPATYKNINIRISFTGKMRLAKDIIEERHNHAAPYQKPSAFKTVIDLKFEDGHLIEAKDRSEEVSEIRRGSKRRYKTKRSWKRFKGDMKDLENLE
jgi:hypothetical protein